ncbi:MAG: glycosyltransferase family 4 protein [Planctomycetota bacterium]
MANSGCRDAGGTRRVFVVTPFEDPAWRWLAPRLAAQPIEWTFHNLSLFGQRQEHWLRAAWRAAPAAREHDLVISHHPYMTFHLALALLARGIRRPHLAFSFNHGNKRFFRGLQLRAARRLFRDVDFFIVFSEGERRLFHEMYGIPLERLGFQHWAVQPPVLASAPQAGHPEEQPYLCCLGRNNRDFATFLAAVADLPVRAVLVCPRHALNGASVPSNVTVLSDLTMEACMRILAGAVASVVPILDATTGAGHITIVAAMQLGRPQIVSRVETVREYFFERVHGWAVEPRSPVALRAALQELLGDPPLAARMGTAAARFANQWLSEAAAVRHLRAVLAAWRSARPYPLEPPGWSAYRAEAAAHVG